MGERENILGTAWKSVTQTSAGLEPRHGIHSGKREDPLFGRKHEQLWQLSCTNKLAEPKAVAQTVCTPRTRSYLGSRKGH